MRRGSDVRRRTLTGVALAAVALGVLVPVGRWERSRAARDEMAGMRRTLALVGPLASPSLSGYRVLPGFDCLTYRRGPDPFALELCVDSSGRLVETIDRRTATRHIASLRADPTHSTIRVDRAEVDRLLRKMESR
jgi:hypothetical protein